MSPRTTVAIPLHRSQPWTATVIGNMERLLGRAHLVVSDATGDDGTLDRIRKEFAGRDGIEFLGPRELDPGWVAHCNDLLDRARTPYFMWLPHDDEIGPEWVMHGEEVLDANEDAVLVIGPIVALDRPEGAHYPARIDPSADFFGPTDLEARVRGAVLTAVLGDASQLGIAFRAVLRREATCALPREPEGGDWADILWALRMAGRGQLLVMPDVDYGKRWHPGSAHAAWRNLREDPEFRQRMIPTALSEVPQDTVLAAITQAWGEDVRMLQHAAVDARGAADRVRAEFQASRSWRLTRPLRLMKDWRRRASR